MIAYHYDSNVLLSEPFKTHINTHRLIAYNSIMQRLKNKHLLVDIQNLDNEAIKVYIQIVTSDWGVKFQLVPPHIHHRNTAERAI